MPTGLNVLSPAVEPAPDNRASALMLVFLPGERPDADTIARIVETSRETGFPVSVSHRPAGQAEWLELLSSGLTFDLTGLAPSLNGAEGGEAITLVPADHVRAGAGLQPILRTMLGLAANLVMELPVQSVGWGPAGTVMEPGYFCRSVLNWLGGGAFPAAGLTALIVAEDGSIISRGLAHFTGQEMQLEGRAGEASADAQKLAPRVIDRLVRHGRLTQPTRIDVDGQALLAEPSQVGNLVLVWREDRG